LRLEQTLELLWGDDSRPVGRSGSTIADFVRAATQLLDEGGAAALSVRAVAERLGVRTMAVYSFGDKDSLVALVVDRSYQGLYSDAPALGHLHWRAGLSQVAATNRDLYRAHPWLLDLQPVRSLMGPWELRKRDQELACLEAMPLDDVERDHIITQLLLLVAGVTRAQLTLLGEQERSGLGDTEWWGTVLPALTPVVDPVRFPRAVRVGAAAQAARDGEFWSEAGFTFGVDRLLDGIGHLIASRATPPLSGTV